MPGGHENRIKPRRQCGTQSKNSLALYYVPLRNNTPFAVRARDTRPLFVLAANKRRGGILI